MKLLLLVAMAKANDNINKPWLIAAIYVAIMLFGDMLFSSYTQAFIPIFLSLSFAFIIVGLLLSLLYRYQDTILAWLCILFAGLFVLSGGAKLLLGIWLL